MKKVLQLIVVICGFTLMFICLGIYSFFSGDDFEFDTNYTGF